VTLGKKQELFASLLPVLLNHAHTLGYQVRLRELWRTKEQAEWNARDGSGIVNSLHCKGLAIDLVLFRDLKMMRKTESYRQLGEFWEDIHDLTAWGGRFGDGGHFSIMHGGVK